MDLGSFECCYWDVDLVISCEISNAEMFCLLVVDWTCLVGCWSEEAVVWSWARFLVCLMRVSISLLFSSSIVYTYT